MSIISYFFSNSSSKNPKDKPLMSKLPNSTESRLQKTENRDADPKMSSDKQETTSPSVMFTCETAQFAKRAPTGDLLLVNLSRVLIVSIYSTNFSNSPLNTDTASTSEVICSCPALACSTLDCRYSSISLFNKQ